MKREFNASEGADGRALCLALKWPSIKHRRIADSMFADLQEWIVLLMQRAYPKCRQRSIAAREFSYDMVAAFALTSAAIFR